MSSDNGTYILETSGPEFRVAHFQAVDNLFEEYNTEKNMWTPNIKYVYENFKNSKVYQDLTEAWDAAKLLDDSVEISEYGTNLISDFSDISFKEIEEKYHGSKS